MTDKQFNQLMDRFPKAKSPGWDIVQKISLPMIAAICGWMLDNNIQYGKALVEIVTEIKNLSEDLKEATISIDKLEDFTAEPRFTQKDYDQQTKPITDALLVITGELKDIKENERDMTLKLQKLESDVEELKRKR